jgi:hypothetical protein
MRTREVSVEVRLWATESSNRLVRIAVGAAS